MTLLNVTDTYQHEVPPHAPVKPPVYDLTPPVDLTDPEVFSKHGGYTHDAFALMREKAPVMWHPEHKGAGFWRSPPMTSSNRSNLTRPPTRHSVAAS